MISGLQIIDPVTGVADEKEEWKENPAGLVDLLRRVRRLLASLRLPPWRPPPGDQMTSVTVTTERRQRAPPCVPLLYSSEEGCALTGRRHRGRHSRRCWLRHRLAHGGQGSCGRAAILAHDHYRGRLLLFLGDYCQRMTLVAAVAVAAVGPEATAAQAASTLLIHDNLAVVFSVFFFALHTIAVSMLQRKMPMGECTWTYWSAHKSVRCQKITNLRPKEAFIWLESPFRKSYFIKNFRRASDTGKVCLRSATKVLLRLSHPCVRNVRLGWEQRPCWWNTPQRVVGSRPWPGSPSPWGSLWGATTAEDLRHTGPRFDCN